MTIALYPVTVRLLPKISIDFCLFIRPNVRFGSLADIPTSPRHVRFTPNNGSWAAHIQVRIWLSDQAKVDRCSPCSASSAA